MKKIIILLTILTLVGCSNNQEKSRNIFYMDTYINVKIYTDNPNIDYKDSVSEDNKDEEKYSVRTHFF